MTHRRPYAAALLAGPLALALVACGGDDDRDDDAPVGASAASSTAPTTPAPSSTAPSASSDDASPAVGTRGDVLVAAGTALAAVQGATLFTIDGEDSGWEVTLVAADGSESEVDVSPDGASVTRDPVADRDDDDRDDDGDDRDDLAERQRLLAEAELDHVAAIEAALGAVPSGTVTGADLDLEQGRATWDVQLDEDTAEERTVTIDAVTGEVLRTERDD